MNFTEMTKPTTVNVAALSDENRGQLDSVRMLVAAEMVMSTVFDIPMSVSGLAFRLSVDEDGKCLVCEVSHGDSEDERNRLFDFTVRTREIEELVKNDPEKAAELALVLIAELGNDPLVQKAVRKMDEEAEGIPITHDLPASRGIERLLG